MTKPHAMKPEAMTKDQLDAALETLREKEKRNNADSNLFRISASCYRPVPPTWVETEITCERCGKKGSLLVATYSKQEETDSDIVSKYNALADRFAAMGYQAKMSYYCDECVAEGEDELGPIVFRFKAPGMEAPAISYPDSSRYNPQRYEQALAFLNDIAQSGDKKNRGYYEYFYLKMILAPERIHLWRPEKDPRHSRRECFDKYNISYKKKD